MEAAAARDYYRVLGVDRGADSATIKRAFRAQARKYHPDVSSDPDAEQKFRELAEAYASLSQPARRILYDRFGYRGAAPTSAGAFADLLQFWARARSRRRGTRAGAVADVELGFYEAARGTRKTIRYRRQAECTQCSSTSETCPSCEGRGTTRRRKDTGDMLVLQLVKCELCGGSGRLVESPCAECGGSGTVEEQREIDVLLPSGIADGDRLKVPGDEGAFVHVRVAPQPADSALVRAAAALGLLVAVAFLALVLFR